jgi:hypothetical protein
MPAEAKGTGPEAAKAFVKHYLNVLGYAARTGDVTGLKALASPECSVCSLVTGRIEKIYRDGGKISGQGYKVASSRMQTSSANTAVLHIDVLQLPQTAVLAKGKPPTQYPESHLPSVFTLAAAGGAWSLRDWVRA